MDHAAHRCAANLSALERVDPGTRARLALPVGSDHLAVDAAGRLVRSWRGAAVDLEAGTRSLREARAPGAPLVQLGAGSGRALDAALSRGERVVLWEPDPALVRVLFERFDWAEPLATRRLQLVLGADLVELARRRPPGAVVVDVATAHMRAPELRLFEAAGERPIAVLVEGRLLVEPIATALHRRGVDAYQLDVERLAREELDRALRVLAPAFALAINDTSGLAEWTADAGVPLVVWEIDPTTDEPRPLARSAPLARVFTYRRSHVEGFRRAGHGRVEHLPLAADTVARRRRHLLGPDRVRYSAPVAFVGASLVEQSRVLSDRFARALGRVLADDRALLERSLVGVERALAEQDAEPGHYRLPDLLARHAPELVERWSAGGEHERPEALLGELVAARWRAAAIGAAAPFGVHVWGDEGWREHLAGLGAPGAGARYRGPAGNREEIERVYSGATVNLDVGRAYQSDIVTLRVFDVLACGGLCLTERNDELEELFEVGVELDAWTDLDDLSEKLGAYLADPARAAAVGAAGRRAVEERHSLDLRLERMLAGLALPGGARAA